MAAQYTLGLLRILNAPKGLVFWVDTVDIAKANGCCNAKERVTPKTAKSSNKADFCVVNVVLNAAHGGKSMRRVDENALLTLLERFAVPVFVYNKF